SEPDMTTARDDAPLGLADIASLGTVVGVWAHPDDESYLAGGLMAALVDAGCRVVSLTATLGEQGIPGVPGAHAARRRRDELAAALEILGVRESHVLDIPDGACPDADEEVAVARIAALVAAVDPDTVLTFGPDGMTGHPDHRTVSRWAGRARAAAGPR